MYIKVSIKNIDYYVWVYTSIKSINRPLLIFNHGWLNDHLSFEAVYKKLEDEYDIVSFDQLGFGSSDDIKEVFDLDDYGMVLNQIINTFSHKRIYLVAHSFGTRVVMKYMACYQNSNIKGLILESMAGITTSSFKIKYKIFKYKMKKFFLKHIKFISKKLKNKYQILINNSGSSDYKFLNKNMKLTMTKVIKEDLSMELKNIKVKTLVAWGKLDNITYFNESKYYLKYLLGSRLIVFYNSSHFPHLEEQSKFVGLIKYGINEYFK